MEQLFCPWDAPQYFIDSSNIPTLFFYSHFPAIIVALILGFSIFFNTKKSLLGYVLLIITLLFSAWNLFDLVLWATNDPNMVMFFWSLQILIEPLIYVLSFYLIYLFIKKKDLSLKKKSLIFLFYLPIVLLLPTNYVLEGVVLEDCTAVEGPIAQYYTYILEFLTILSIFIFSFVSFKKNKDVKKRTEIKIFSIAIILFLFLFSWGNLIGSFTDNWVLAQAGLIGMPLFAGVVVYMFVKFKTFNTKLLFSNAVVFALLFLVLAMAFVRSIENVRIIVAFTLIAVLYLGNILNKGVKREIEQKEHLLELNQELQSLLQQRESLVHLITHKVKASFTRSKYIFAEMTGGGFGELSAELKGMAQTGLDSDNEGIKTVDLVLNAFNLEKGIVKYDMKEMDFKDLVLDSFKSRKAPAEAKGLSFNLNIEENQEFKIMGDVFWLHEVTNNLIENAVRYTLKGEVLVSLKKNGNKLLFSVKDTGVGITDEDKKNLFNAGGRGKNSVKVNVDSTGYGLYSVRLIVEAHGGRVWAESEGEGKGSTFSVEFDLAK